MFYRPPGGLLKCIGYRQNGILFSDRSGDLKAYRHVIKAFSEGFSCCILSRHTETNSTGESFFWRIASLTVAISE
jgi:hypothetical protein